MLELLIDIILDNTRLTYDKEKLTIDDDNAVIQVIRVLQKERYNKRLEELKGNAEKKSN